MMLRVRLSKGVVWRFGGLLWLACVVFLMSGMRAQEIPAWNLVWSDEFNQRDGTAPSSIKWAYDVGGGGWGNQELQYYTWDRRENARIEGGHLIIEARKEEFTVWDGTWNYTSARLKTQGLRTWTHGRMEARIKLPTGRGLWSAFWMLGDNISDVGWPNCGEIDIMENVGHEPSTVHASVHGPSFNGTEGFTALKTLSSAVSVDGFHLYTVEWDRTSIRMFLDNVEYFTLPKRLVPFGEWVYDDPFYLILNVAVGGIWPGTPPPSTVFPAQMRVDYVRVYAPTTAAVPELVIRPGAVGNEVMWPGSFPQGVLYRADTPHSTWTKVPMTGLFVNGMFKHEEVSTGFFRLGLD